MPVWEQVIADMRKRDEFGTKKYGFRLQARNNRNPLQDLYEELLDSVVYLKQAIIEGRFVIEQPPAKEPEKMFPLQTSRSRDVKPGPIQIPWSIAENRPQPSRNIPSGILTDAGRVKFRVQFENSFRSDRLQLFPVAFATTLMRPP